MRRHEMDRHPRQHPEARLEPVTDDRADEPVRAERGVVFEAQKWPTSTFHDPAELDVEIGPPGIYDLVRARAAVRARRRRIAVVSAFVAASLAVLLVALVGWSGAWGSGVGICAPWDRIDFAALTASCRRSSRPILPSCSGLSAISCSPSACSARNSRFLADLLGFEIISQWVTVLAGGSSNDKKTGT